MPTQAITQQGYNAAIASYRQYCAARGIQPDPAFLQAIAAEYGYSGTLPRGVDIQAVTDAERLAEEARQFDITNAETIRQAALERTAAERLEAMHNRAWLEAARIGNQAGMAQAAAGIEEARIQAAAAIEAANIAAAASRYSDDIKAHIADEANELERQRVAAIELARPGDWVARVGYMRGQTPEQSKALTQYAGGTVFGGQMPGALPQPATAGAGPVAAQAVVGERGPELATATPQGTQITPLQAEQAGYLRGRLPQMAGGGVVGGYTTPTYKFPATRNTGAVRSELLNPSQMLETMVGRSRTPDEYLQRQATGLRWMAGGLPQTTGGGVAPTTSVNTPAGAGGTAAPPGTTGTATGAAASPINDLTIFQAARAGGQYGLPAFQAWTGPTRNTVTGVEIPPPWQINLQQFSNMTRAEQAMMAGHWRSMGMIPGETEDEMLSAAYDAMRRSAFTGMASALPQYAGMR